MFCEMNKLPGRFDNTIMHWYQLKENKPPERLLFFEGGKARVESGFQDNKYMVDKVSTRNLCILTINDVSPDDAATYYCAYWDPHHDRCSETSKTHNSFNHAASTSVYTTGLLLPHSPSLLSPSAIVSAATQSKHCTDAESHKRAGRDLWRSSSPTSLLKQIP